MFMKCAILARHSYLGRVAQATYAVLKNWSRLNRLCSMPIPLADRHGVTQTNKPLNDLGLSKLLSRGD